jgi:outer membrane protein assembly factor BamB
MSRLLSFGLALAIATGAPGAPKLAGDSPANWPQWRGPKNDGVSTAKGLPAEFSDAKNVLWKLPMPGMSGATPCVWGDRIFLTSGDDKDQLIGLCIGTDGKEVWRKVLGKGGGKARGDEGTGSSASPSTDGKHVWFFVGTGDLACHDFDGNEVWKVNVQERYGKFRIQFGMHSTPALFRGKLYLQLLHDGGQNVICLDAETGKEDWKVDRPSDGRAECLHSYASPFIWTDGTDAYLVSHGNDYAVAHDLKDGHEIWRVGDLNGKEMKYNPTLRFVASPLCTPDLIVVPSAKNGPVVAIKPTAKGKVNAGNEYEVWRRPTGTPDVPSPLVHDGVVYLARENGFLECLDAKTGKDLYAPQRLHNSRYRASPLYADGKVYIAARDGVVSVVKAGRTFELLAENRMAAGEEITASPIAVDGRLYIRGFKNLYAIGSK